jgi:hypothetical protein
MRGPLNPGCAPQELEYWVRRYRCRRCGAIVNVGPSEGLRYRLFSLIAVVWAIALYGIERLPSREVRRRVSPWRIVGTSAARWSTLRRWLRAAESGVLLATAPAVSGTPREIARRLSYVLSASAPPGFRDETIAEQTVHGALHRAMGIAPCAPAATASTTQGCF